MTKYDSTIQRIKEAIQDSFSMGAVLRKLGLKITTSNKQSIKRVIRGYNIDTSHFDRNKAISLFRTNNTFPRWDIQKLQERIAQSTNLGEVLEKMNLRKAGGNYDTLRKYIKVYSLDISHFIKVKNFSKLTSFERILTYEQIFCIDSKADRSTLKKRILKDNIIEYICKDCGLLPIWNNKPLTLQIEHKNGIHNDNRLENLCWLCPNCHSQTKTYAGKSSNKQ